MANFAPADLFKNNHGSLLGGTTGFAMGGPIGALLGSALGYAYDRTRKALFTVESIYNEINNDVPETGIATGISSRAQEAAFTIGVIALGAKLARLNKKLDRDTIEAFRVAFRLPPSDIPMIRKMFEQALFDAVGHKPYADQLSTIFMGRPEMLEALLQGLVRFAHAEEEGLTPAVLDYLDSLAIQFQISKSRMEDILKGEGLTRPGANPNIKPFVIKQTPFDVLGVTRNAPEIVIKQAYRTLLKESHPDMLAPTGTAEMLATANDRVAEINAAYASIKKIKGWG